LGTKNQNDSSVANGHEARRRIAARDPLNDPYRIVERYVGTSRDGLGRLVTFDVWEADYRITIFSDPDHAFVYDNYVQGNKCGQAWVFDTADVRYKKIEPQAEGGAESKMSLNPRTITSEVTGAFDP